MAICNKTNNLRAFKILKTSTISDHCPVLLSIDVAIQPSLALLRECNRYSFNYEHLDVSKRLTSPINVRRINASRLMEELETLCNDLSDSNITDIEQFADQMSTGIYNACKSSQTKRNKLLTVATPVNCTSKHIRAICDAHFFLYTFKVETNAPVQEINEIAMKWWDYKCLVVDMESKEYNTCK